jgi:microsomal dipeptidase-like Zn-dependent dipeptidase
LGREVIKLVNTYGMMVDFSHPSKGAMMEMLKLSKAPIIGPHSAVRAICSHSRNADDETAHGARQERRRHPDRRVRVLRQM